MQFHIFIIELQYQYLNYITGIPVLYKILKKIRNIEEQLCIVFMYTGNLYHLHDLAIWKWFKNVYIWSAFVYDAQLISDFVR
jgi:hypothetical protein